MNEFILLWLLLGSMGCNFIWALRYEQGYFKRKYKNIHYINGILIGLLLGPLNFTVFVTLLNKKKRNAR